MKLRPLLLQAHGYGKLLLADTVDVDVEQTLLWLQLLLCCSQPCNPHLIGLLNL
jgi:hypothetical protein